MGVTVSDHEQAQDLLSFITANTVVDRVEIAQTIVGVDLGVEAALFPLVWLALAYVGSELYAHASGDGALDALGALACTRLFSGDPCPNCRKMAVFYDGLSERWTYEARDDEPWGEWVCPIFFDDVVGHWHRACLKGESNGG